MTGSAVFYKLGTVIALALGCLDRRCGQATQRTDSRKKEPKSEPTTLTQEPFSIVMPNDRR